MIGRVQRTEGEVWQTLLRPIIQVRESTGGSRRRRPTHIYRDSLSNMPAWIRRFLQSMRRNFPPVCIAGPPHVRGEAAAEKDDWGQDMMQYDAGAAGVLFLSEAIISNMSHARQQDPTTAQFSYQLFKFQMAISVAHEIVHFLTGFITGTMVPDTPPRVTAEPYNDRADVGEAGRYWESIILGGFVEFWSSTTDRLGVRQAGMPYLFNTGNQQTSTSQKVSMAYIEDFLDGRTYSRFLASLASSHRTWTDSSPRPSEFTFPIRVSSQTDNTPMTRRALERTGSQETTKLRLTRPFRTADRVDSPPPGHTSTGARFRSINLGPEYTYAQREEYGRHYYR
jgi:hypothetical protein